MAFGQVMIKRSNFLKNLELFPKEQINEEMFDFLKLYLEMIDCNANDIKASSSVAGLCSWVIRMVAHHQVEKFVQPKKQQKQL
jgi:hypothetical protein